MVAVGSRYKDGTGLLWLFTWGLFGVGQIYDLLTLRRQVEEANLSSW